MPASECCSDQRKDVVWRAGSSQRVQFAFCQTLLMQCLEVSAPTSRNQDAVAVLNFIAMNEDRATNDSNEHRKAWLEKLGDELIKLEALFPFSGWLPDENSPTWVANVERELTATMYPVAKIKNEHLLMPKRMGAIIGHSCAYGVWVMEASEQQIEVPESVIEKITSEQWERGEKTYQQLVNEWYPAVRRFAKRALCSCVDQTYEDMSEFLLAFSQAFSRKPKSLRMGDIGTSAIQIYCFLLQNWRHVNALKSVHELHQLLVTLFGSNRAGDLKRIEKMCQRIDLHYRKPGRPKKPK